MYKNGRCLGKTLNWLLDQLSTYLLLLPTLSIVSAFKVNRRVFCSGVDVRRCRFQSLTHGSCSDTVDWVLLRTLTYLRAQTVINLSASEQHFPLLPLSLSLSLSSTDPFQLTKLLTTFLLAPRQKFSERERCKVYWADRNIYREIEIETLRLINSILMIHRQF